MAHTRAVSVGVLGASGTAGGEVVRLLLGHPAARVVFLGAEGSAGRTLGAVHPHLAGTPLASEVLRTLEEAQEEALEVAIFALAHGASARWAPALLEGGVRVIDLGGDFRLDAEAYPEWYGFEHPAPGWLERSVYGLPELFGGSIADAELVANPGCFPTPVVLGLAPLLAEGRIDPSPIVVDGKTGISGAGRSPSEATSFVATEESVRPYRVPRHQHTPEMERALALGTGVDPAVSFVPHLVPSVRGVLTTCYAPLAAGETTDSLTDCLRRAYAAAPFVRVLPPGGMVDTKRTRGSNAVELQAVADPRTGMAVVAGALDNLGKGAAGQAVQNLNLMFGLPETLGLATTGVYP
jgi:N-acetyl-gamma-glutamyl-phosphate reductase